MGIFDCDTHCYETRDSFTRYLPKELLDRAIAPVRLPDGQETILADDRIAVFNSEQGLGFDQAYRPGSLKEMLKQMASGNPDETYQPEPMRPEYQERAARLRVARRAGGRPAACCTRRHGAVGRGVRQGHAEPLYANVHSFNRWFDETWGFNHGERIYADGAAVVARPRPRGDRTRARARAGRPGRPAADRAGARAVARRPVLRPALGPAQRGRRDGRLPHHGALVQRAHRPGLGPRPEPASWHMSAWQWQNTYGQRPIEDTLSALIFDNLFGRFPDLQVLVSEYGAEWVPHFVRHMDKSRGMGRNGPWIGGQLTSGRARSSAATSAWCPTPRTTSVDRRRTSATPTRS